VRVQSVSQVRVKKINHVFCRVWWKAQKKQLSLLFRQILLHTSGTYDTTGTVSTGGGSGRWEGAQKKVAARSEFWESQELSA